MLMASSSRIRCPVSLPRRLSIGGITKSQIHHHVPKGSMGQLNQNTPLQLTKDNLLTSNTLYLVRVIDPPASGPDKAEGRIMGRQPNLVSMVLQCRVESNENIWISSSRTSGLRLRTHLYYQRFERLGSEVERWTSSRDIYVRVDGLRRA